MVVCDMHGELVKDIAVIKNTVEHLDKRINGSLDKVASHIEDGYVWRRVIVGVAITLIIQVIAFAFGYGFLVKSVSVNERIIQRILTKQEIILGKEVILNK